MPDQFPWRHQSIALVGSAQSLLSTSYGSEIDSHDLVVRINQGAFAALDSASTGLRTDYVFLTLTGGTPWAKWLFIRRARRAARRGIVLMSAKGRVVAGIDLATFFLHYPAPWQDELIKTLGHRPSTGAMAVDLLLRTVARKEQVSLYGFDFFQTPDIAHGRNNVVQHDADAERAFILGSIAPGAFHGVPGQD